MFEVNANFIKIMDFESEFNRCAESAGISNPFKVQAAQFAKGCRRDKNGDLIYDPKDAPKDVPTEEEKDSFCRARDEYVARRCFQELGYEVFLAKSGERVKYLRDELEFVPCKSADGQCSFYCPRYQECMFERRSV